MIVLSSKRTLTDPAKPAPSPCGTRLRVVTPPAPENATLGQKMSRLRGELTRWATKGFPMVPKGVRATRLAACKACDYYKPNGNLGLGECSAPGCGCTKVKLALATSKCPHPSGPKWPVWTKPV